MGKSVIHTDFGERMGTQMDKDTNILMNHAKTLY